MKDSNPVADVFFLIISMFLFLGITIFVPKYFKYRDENLTCVLTKQDKVIGKIRSACMDVEIDRNNIRVDISTGFLCMFPKKRYVGNDYRVECE